MNQKVVKNASWIVVCRIAQSLLGMLISMLTARYLGPANFGLISYASSIVTFAVPLMQLGLNNILVQETIQYPQEEGAIFGTSIVMSLCSALACMVGVVSFAYITNVNQTQVVVVCALYSIILLFRAIEMLQYWFQAKLLSKYMSIVSLCAYGVVSAYRVFLLATGKNVYWFAVASALDIMLIACALLWFYRRLGGQRLCFRTDVARRMFSRSKYYILSGLMVTVFAQTDKIMLTLMINETATGYYSAAVNCAGVTAFVVGAIIDSARPAIFESRKKDYASFEKSMTVLYSIIIYFSLTQSVAVTLLAKPIVHILYGGDYSLAINILQILVWYTTFSYLGGAKDIWILAENKQKYLVILNLSGAVANILLNALLIPYYGAAGAAFASLVTQIFTNIIMMVVIRELRKNVGLFVKACSLGLVLSIVRRLFNKEA